MSGVGVAKVAQILDLCNFIPQMELKGHRIMIRDVNRPALQLSGYFEHFEQSRVQIIGTVEYTYLQQLDEKKKEAIYREFMAYDIPCVIFCRDLKPDEMFLKIAEESNLPVFGTKRSTSEFMAELIYCLSEQLAPCITIHGVLVDVYGEGLLIMGESGIGKSEAALELVRRGHRLVTDDVVEIRKIKANLVSVNVDRLVQEGYLERRAVAGDRRKTQLLCTEKAQPVIARGREVQERFFARLLDNTDAATREAFFRTMEVIGKNLDEILKENG